MSAKRSVCDKITLRRLGLQIPLVSLLKELIIKLRQGKLSLILVSVLTSISDTMCMKLQVEIIHRVVIRNVHLYVPLFCFVEI